MAQRMTQSWSERERLGFIERMLFWRGFINRKDLVDFFQISRPQATNDFVHYTTRYPGLCFYNVRSKRYEAVEGFKPVLIEPDFLSDIQCLGSLLWPDTETPFFKEPAFPRRGNVTALLQSLCRAAHHGHSMDIHYFSLNSGTSLWRRISPRTFGYDGLRWHVRAFCHQNEDFRDFTVGRIAGMRNVEDCQFTGVVDHAWHQVMEMKVEPHPDLSENNRKAIEMDFAMENGSIRWLVPKAMLAYTARRLGFISDDCGENLPVFNERKELAWVGLKSL